MPNCDFYALREDSMAVLEFVFGQTECAVYEHYSEPGEELRRFHSSTQVAEAFDLGVGRGASVLLQLYDPSMKGIFRIRRIELNPDRFAPDPWRFEAHGWGAIQLQLGGLSEGKIYASHTNHNSEKRAASREATYFDDLGRADAWDWTAVTRISRKVNRFIQRLAPSKAGSRPLLPAAALLVEQGEADLAITP